LSLYYTFTTTKLSTGPQVGQVGHTVAAMDRLLLQFRNAERFFVYWFTLFTFTLFIFTLLADTYLGALYRNADWSAVIFVRRSLSYNSLSCLTFSKYTIFFILPGVKII